MLAARLPDTYFPTTCHLTHIFIRLVIVMTSTAFSTFHVPVTRTGFQFVELRAGQAEDRKKKATSLLL
jgi:hypothetical protein